MYNVSRDLIGSKLLHLQISTNGSGQHCSRSALSSAWTSLLILESLPFHVIMELCFVTLITLEWFLSLDKKSGKQSKNPLSGKGLINLHCEEGTW